MHLRRLGRHRGSFRWSDTADDISTRAPCIHVAARAGLFTYLGVFDHAQSEVEVLHQRHMVVRPVVVELLGRSPHSAVVKCLHMVKLLHVRGAHGVNVFAKGGNWWSAVAGWRTAGWGIVGTGALRKSAGGKGSQTDDDAFKRHCEFGVASCLANLICSAGTFTILGLPRPLFISKGIKTTRRNSKAQIPSWQGP